MKKLFIAWLFGSMLTLVGIHADNIDDFVERFYVEVLERPSDTVGLISWTDALRSGEKAGSDVAYGFVFSPEYNLNVKDNSSYLTTLYKAFFNRVPDTGGYNLWLDKLNTGMSKEDVLENFLHSPEFTTLAENYGIKPTTTTTTSQTGITGFVERFYTEILERPSDSVGLNSWVDQLETHTATGEDIAKGFIFSPEFTNKTLNNEAYVETFYRAFFGRDADEGGLNTWVNLLNQGLSKEDLLKGFVNSQEFHNLANSYGILATEDDDKNNDDDNDNNHDDDNDDDNDDNQNNDTNNTGGGTTSNNYILTAWNDLGMHCMDGNDFSVFSVLPPYNNLHAQLKDKNGGLVTAGVNISFVAIQGTDGKWNTTSTNKTNFWDYSNKLLGASLATDTGLTGVKTPSTTPEAMTFNTTHQWWEAEGIPLTPYNDDGSKNYYPLVKVVAKDAQGNILAEAKTVLPVSDEMDCKRCHASTVDSIAAKPTSGWVNHVNDEKDYKFNILRLHDQSHPNAISNNMAALQAKGYTYLSQGLEATANAGTPIQCAACHKTNALPGVGIGLKAFTQAIHSKHKNVIDPDNGMTLGNSNNRNACYVCHPGAQTECLRGAMGDAKNLDGSSKMQCQSCHGDISAVGSSAREGWLDEPNCQACHHDGVQETSAIDPATNTLRHVIDTQFATNLNTPAAGISLYRFSTGHGNLQCEACHGATHAIYPAHNADNMLSEGIQGHAGTIGECSSCHTTVPNTNTGGPHGMHPVGQSWVKGHEKVAENNPAQCKVCHGQDYRGSPLSKMWTARTLNVENGTKNLPKGHQVSCYDCHNGPNGG